MANYPDAQSRLADLIDLYFKFPPVRPVDSQDGSTPVPGALLEDWTFYGDTFQKAVEDLAAHVVEDYTFVADARSRGKVTVWKIFDIEFMFDADIVVNITSGSAARLLALKIIVNPLAGWRWNLTLFNWSANPSSVERFQGRTSSGSRGVNLNMDPTVPPGSAPSGSGSSRGTG